MRLRDVPRTDGQRIQRGALPGVRRRGADSQQVQILRLRLDHGHEYIRTQGDRLRHEDHGMRIFRLRRKSHKYERPLRSDGPVRRQLQPAVRQQPRHEDQSHNGMERRRQRGRVQSRRALPQRVRGLQLHGHLLRRTQQHHRAQRVQELYVQLPGLRGGLLRQRPGSLGQQDTV